MSQTRRRGAELEDAILDAAWAVLGEHGYGGFTYEAVATRAGTSRPVLYRRWPQREDLLLATIRRTWQAHPIELPDTGSLREDALAVLRNAAVARTPMMTLITVQLHEYFRDTGTTFSDLRAALLGPGATHGLEPLVTRAVERGELPATDYPRRAVDLPFDLFRHDLLMKGTTMTEPDMVEVVDELWLPLLHALGRSAIGQQTSTASSSV